MKKNEFLDFLLVYFNLIATFIINLVVFWIWHELVNSNPNGSQGLVMFFVILLVLTIFFISCMILGIRLVYFKHKGVKFKNESKILLFLILVPIIIMAIIVKTQLSD